MTKQSSKPDYEKESYLIAMQLNRIYSARLHVDKNSHGSSYIIALGEHVGGRHWCWTRPDQSMEWPHCYSQKNVRPPTTPGYHTLD